MSEFHVSTLDVVLPEHEIGVFVAGTFILVLFEPAVAMSQEQWGVKYMSCLWISLPNQVPNMTLGSQRRRREPQEQSVELGA
jgi:hypothetical protein